MYKQTSGIMETKPTPTLSGSTGSASSAPPWSPCPPYKPYRPSPRAADPNNLNNPNTTTSTTSVDNMDSSTAVGATAAVDMHAAPDSSISSILPTGKKSLAGISLRAFVLGQVAGLSVLATILLLLLPGHYIGIGIDIDIDSSYSALWRAPFFLASLCTFHFLEFYTTARYNTSYATVSAFLLSTNGAAYNLAHSSALAECVLSRVFLAADSRYFTVTAAPVGGVRGQIGLGLLLMFIGQAVRSLAMAQAGANFTHTIQRRRRDEHVLVTSGVYGVLRHPSYFGFFWWGLGTQLVLGNAVCLVGYAVVLWTFFAERVKSRYPILLSVLVYLSRCIAD